MNSKASNSERKALHHARYKGEEIVEVLEYQNIFGNQYCEIRFEDGTQKSVPVEDIDIERK